MSDFIKDLLGELIDDYVTQIEGDIRIWLLDCDRKKERQKGVSGKRC